MADDHPSRNDGIGKWLAHPGSWVACGGGLVAFMVLLTYIGPAWWRGDGLEWLPPLSAVSAVYALAGTLFLVIAWQLKRTKPTKALVLWIILIGLAMRLACFLGPIQYETDHYRYLWDGAVTANGYNPYHLSPKQLLMPSLMGPESSWEDPKFGALVEAGQPTLQRVNNPSLTTIYPPLTEACFAVAYCLDPFGDHGLRIVFFLADLLILALLAGCLRHHKQPMHQLMIYWWNPLLVSEFFVKGHMDGLALVFVVAAVLLALKARHLSALAALSLGVGVKLWPIVLAPYFLFRGKPSSRAVAARIVLLGLACVVLTFPLAVNWGLGQEASGLSAYAREWRNNSGCFQLLLWLAELIASPSSANILARGITLVLLGSWLGMIFLKRDSGEKDRLPEQIMLATCGLFLLSPSQFPWYFSWILPFLVFAPRSPLLLYTVLLSAYHLDVPYPNLRSFFVWLQHLPIWVLLGWQTWCFVRKPSTSTATDDLLIAPKDLENRKICVIIPVLNEERALPKVLAEIPSWVSEVIVADNGSADNSVAVAKAGGARVVHQSERGYGAACLAAIDALPEDVEIVVFIDGDHSDYPEEMISLIAPILSDRSDMVIGSRVLGDAEPGALTPQQRFGNALACVLMRFLYDARFTDLGPFRAIRASSLKELEMDDRNYGWTVQMQVRAVSRGVPSSEVGTSYRCRTGVSKISGTVRGVIGAGTKIIYTIFRELFKT